MLLLKSFTADATSQYCEVGDADYISIFASGTVGGGTLTIQCSPNAGVTWFSYEPSGTPLALAATLANSTDSDIRILEGVGGMRIRAVLAGATSPACKLYVSGKYVHIPDLQS